MEHDITVGQLRQNPTSMIRAVRDGATYTLTDRGRPVAEIVPVRPRPWRPAEEVNALLRELGPDPALADDVRRLRSGTELRDPWAGR